MTMTRAALVQCPVWWTVDPPLGLAQIAGCLGARGIDAVVVDLNAELARSRAPDCEGFWNWEQFHRWNDPAFVRRVFEANAKTVDGALARVLASDAAVVGFSVSAGSQEATLEFARRVKREDPRRAVVLGGQYFFKGGAASRLAADPAVDAVLRGPGDELFALLVEEYAGAGRISPRPGVVARAGGEVVDGGSAEAPRDLDRLPFADFRGFRLELYDVPERLPIHMSRGCVWRCRFCSSHAFWPGYAFMSGERVHAEILEHKRRHPEKTHFEFHDITANGSVKSLRRLAELVVEDWKEHAKEHFFGWKINAILRPEMDAGLLGLLSKANCHDVIYGVESGSPRVLKLMDKPYDPAVAERVLRDTKAAGITTVGNFMFGFPGETEEDFGLTLDFLRRNRASFDRVYASATFTSLEEHSWISEHRAEAGIKDDGPGAHHLYWESADGTNTYPARLARYERFRALAAELGLDAYKGIDGSLEAERRENLAAYGLHRLDRQRSNLALNAREHDARREILSSTPRRVFLQINAACNADCVFCSKGRDYPVFSFDDYLKVLGPRLDLVISRAEELVLTGSGELLGLPDAERILDYFNREFPHVDKYIATNASHARPRIWELIAGAESRYTIQLSLHAADPESHRAMMRYGAWEQVQRNVRFLAERRKAAGNPRLKAMFVMTTLNAERLPEFVRWAADVGVDEVIAGYFYVYESHQKYLSLYFRQDLANRVIDEARRTAEALGVALRLPPRFGEPPPGWTKPASCPEPWHQIMINSDGRVLPCDVYGDFDESLAGRSFEEVWNGPAYRAARRALGGGGGCLATCPRQNAAAVNDWRAHVIHRHKDPAQIVEEHKEALRKP